MKKEFEIKIVMTLRIYLSFYSSEMIAQCYFSEQTYLSLLRAIKIKECFKIKLDLICHYLCLIPEVS